MKYCTNDGKKIFDTEAEVIAYEEELAEKERIEREKEAKKEDRRKALKDARKALYDNVKQFEKDYGETIDGGRITYISSGDVFGHHHWLDDFFRNW